jgi:amino acid adenylation domain-containing protein
MVAALLAVLKAGAAYLPLDADYPPDRLSFMLQDAGVRLLLSHSGIALPQVQQRLDLDRQRFDDQPDSNPDSGAAPDNLAYVIYTSGSTGQPKGVLVPHRGLVNLTEDKIRKCDVRPGDCVLQFFSFSFDGSVPELVMTLAVGARLLMAPSETMLPGPGLRDLMQRNGVTHITITPSALTALPDAPYPELRMVLVGGEAPSPELIQHWSRGRHFINAYGPTETTVNASMVHCGNGEPLEPTVLPSANKQLYVLDEDLQIVPVGAVGELHIGGVGITRGYLHQPAMTAERFIPNPFASDAGADPSGHYPAPVLYRSGDLASYLPDGRIRLLGRIDQQTKLRGFRIELAEIERVLDQHPQVLSGLVRVREHAGDRRLVAYGVANTEQPDSPAEMRRFLADKLPLFMLPAAFVWLPALPLTSNGKLDLDALPEPAAALGTGGQAPRTANEALLADLFADVLSIDAVGIHDNFFELGGHSLLATRLIARLMDGFDIDVTILDLFEAPSVAELAQRIEHKQHLHPLLGAAGGENEREEIAL